MKERKRRWREVPYVERTLLYKEMCDCGHTRGMHFSKTKGGWVKRNSLEENVGRGKCGGCMEGVTIPRNVSKCMEFSNFDLFILKQRTKVREGKKNDAE